MKHKLLALLFLAVPAMASSTLDDAILSEDWKTVLTFIERPGSARTPGRNILKAHALLASNRNNDAACLFGGQSSPNDLADWESWSKHFAATNPDKPIVHFLYGDALARQSKWEEAIGAFKEALRINPRHVLSLNARGVVYSLTRRYDEALLDFAAAESINPLFVDVKINRGFLNISRKYSASALQRNFDSALALNPNASLAILGKSWALLARGNDLAGLSALEAAPRPCTLLNAAVNSDHAILLGWLKRQQESLVALANSPEAGTTLTDMLKDISTKRDIASVKKAIDFAAKSGDPELQKRATNTLKSLENIDKSLAPVIGKAVNESKIENEIKRGDLLKQGSTKTAAEAELALQVKKGGVNIGGATKATMFGDSKNYADQQLKDLAKKESFTQQLNDNLKSGKAQTGGAETIQIRMARVDRGDVPPIFHNGLFYRNAADRTEETK